MKSLTIFNQNYSVAAYVASNLLAARNRKETVAIIFANGLLNGTITPIINNKTN